MPDEIAQLVEHPTYNVMGRSWARIPLSAVHFHANVPSTCGYAPVIRLKWRFLADMPIFTPTKRICLDSQILSHWYHFEAQLTGNNILKKIGILSTEILEI